MTRLADGVHRVARSFATLAMWLAGVGLLLMTLAIGWQVFGRYVLNDSPAWSESLALILMLYFILFAAAVGVRERFHLGFGLLASRLTGRARRSLDVTHQCLIAGFGAAMLWNGAVLADHTATHIIPALGVTRSLAYWPFIGSGGLMILFALDHILVVRRSVED